MSSEEFVASICAKNDWKCSDIIRRNLTNYFRAEQYYGITRNNDLLSNCDVFSHPQCPSAQSEMGLLISIWKRKHTNEDLVNISTQVAAPARNLRNRGFRFRTGEKKDGYTAKRYTFKENGKEYREIIGFDPSRSLVDGVWMKLNKSQKVIIKSEFCEDLMGDSYQPSHAEIDHRRPEIVRKREGLAPVPLTEESLKDGSWIDDYQVMSKTSNNRKREACSACQNGKEIRIPLGLSAIRSAYKLKYDEDNKGCLGCWWHDPLRPKNPKHLPDLDKAKYEQLQKIERIKQRICPSK